MESPSLIAHNLALILEDMPIPPAKPTCQFPSSSLINPPQAAGPGFPLEQPSIFNLKIPGGGLDHLISFNSRCASWIGLDRKEGTNVSYVTRRGRQRLDPD